jgi:hypothetical protein
VTNTAGTSLNLERSGSEVGAPPHLLLPALIEDTDEAVHFVQSEAVQAFRFQAVHGSEVKSSTLAPLFGSLMDGG